MSAETAKPELWQVALRSLTEGSIDWLHPLDRIHVIRMLRDLYAVGERPDLATFTAYAKKLWPEWGKSERWVRDRWREILRNPRHRFRVMVGFEYEEQPFYLLEHLAEKHGLEPVEARLQRVGIEALDAYAERATTGSRDEFDRARGELEDAMASLARLRRLRFGGPFDDR
jgi:hypothetical protein